MTKVICRRCRKAGEHEARGLCKRCYFAMAYRKTLSLYPRKGQKRHPLTWRGRKGAER